MTAFATDVKLHARHEAMPYASSRMVYTVVVPWGRGPKHSPDYAGHTDYEIPDDLALAKLVAETAASGILVGLTPTHIRAQIERIITDVEEKHSGS